MVTGAGHSYVNIKSANVGDWSTSGLSVTGALSASGHVTIDGTSKLILKPTDYSGYQSYVYNSGSGSSAKVEIGQIPSTAWGTFSSSGLAVTGALSATGGLGLNNGNVVAWGGIGSSGIG